MKMKHNHGLSYTTNINSEARIWTQDGLFLKLIFLSLYTTDVVIVENWVILFAFFITFLNHPQTYQGTTKGNTSAQMSTPLSFQISLGLGGAEIPKRVMHYQ